jgi:cytochrome c oxidase cbb3-type subunit IV
VKTESIMQILMSYVTTWWTPAFFVLFFAVLAYALWPRNRGTFDAAAKIPLRED